jgi:ATP-binding cassette subfamily B protein
VEKKSFSLATIRNNLELTPRTMRLAWRSARSMTLLLALLTVMGALLPLLVVYVGKLIIDAVVAHDADLTVERVLLELGVVAFQALVMRSNGLVRQLLGARLSVDVNLMILRKAQELDIRHFEDAEFYDRLTRARREASSRPLSVITESFQRVQNVLTLAGYIVLLVCYNVWAVLGLFLAALPAAMTEFHFSTVAFRLRNWRSPETRRLNYVEHVLANDAHAKEVRLFGLGPHLLERYRTTGERLYLEDRQLAVRRFSWSYVLSLAATAAFYTCYGFMAFAAAAGRITLGNLTLYVGAFRQGQQAFQSILSGIGGMYENNLYMSNLFAYLDVPSPVLQTGGRSAGESGGAAIRFEGVGFRYPGQERWALRHVSLEIPRGQSLALVGHNGAGKTTFIKLLTRLYEPTEGRILLDGVDLREWNAEALYKRIGVIFQDFNRYQFTVRENVGVGSIDHAADTARVERAIERGGATAVVGKLPLGLEAPLGRWFNDGAELSGGQWQTIALARAYMREEADILVLDEPTAALDAEAEYAVFERFRELTRGRTTILISHRFPTVRMADRIVVIEGGGIVEQGSHAELIARGGRYAELFALQARGYQ